MNIREILVIFGAEMADDTETKLMGSQRTERTSQAIKDIKALIPKKWIEKKDYGKLPPNIEIDISAENYFGGYNDAVDAMRKALGE